jgi:hypothetical protein
MSSSPILPLLGGPLFLEFYIVVNVSIPSETTLARFVIVLSAADPYTRPLFSRLNNLAQLS